MLQKLTIFSLLILFLPFFQTCSDKSIMESNMLKNNPYEEHAIDKELKPNEKEFNLDFGELRQKKKIAISKFLALRDSLTSNGYETGYLFIRFIGDRDWNLLPFSVSILINFLLVVLAFLRKTKAVLFFAIANIALNVLPVIFLYSDGIIDDWDQLKIGYFLLIFNLLLISSISFQEVKTSSNRR